MDAFVKLVAASGQRPGARGRGGPMSAWCWRLPGRAACWSGWHLTVARGEAKKQIARAAADTPFAPGVAKTIYELIAAVAVTAATSAAS